MSATQWFMSYYKLYRSTGHGMLFSARMAYKAVKTERVFHE